jgi:hypothetical protein
MREDTQLALFFDSVGGRKVQAVFDGGSVTSDAGVMLIRQAERRVGVVRCLTSAMRDRRRQASVQQQLGTLVRQRVFQIACGYEDANDCDDLRRDPALKAACERLPFGDRDLGSQPTMTRLENSVSGTTLYRMLAAMVRHFVHTYAKAPRRIVLDLDDTDDGVHGGQQLSLFNAHYGGYCYEPLHIYEGMSGKLVCTVLRPGKTPSGQQVSAILRRVVGLIRKAWPNTRIIIRGDSHYSSPELHQYCESQPGVYYILGQNVNKRLRRLAPTAWLEQRYQRRGGRLRHCCQRWYRAGTWSRRRRIVFRILLSSQGTDVRAIVTNLPWRDYRRLYEKTYCGRGQMENFIKDHKNALSSDRTSCSRFAANQFRLILHSAAYTLLHYLRGQGLRATELSRAQFDTIMRKLLKVGARVVQSTRRIVLHLPTACPSKGLLRTAVTQMQVPFW